MPRFIRTRLSAMMFLFYFALGSWAVTLSTFMMSSPIKGGLNFTTAEVGWVYSTFALAGMIAPIFVGVLADRLFRGAMILGVSGIVTSLLLFTAGWWCDLNQPVIDDVYREVAAEEFVAGKPVLEQLDALDAHGGIVPVAAMEPLREQVREGMNRVKDHPAVRQVVSDTFRPLFAIMLLQNIAVQLGLTLSTVVTLRNLRDPSADFSRCRLWGTIGWISAGNAVGILLTAVSPQPLYLAAASSGLFGLYSFTLPRTPPKGHGKSLAESFGLPALRLFRQRSFLVFIVIAFAGAAINQFYGVYAHRYLTDLELPRPEQWMTIGQVTEVGVMFMLPLLHPKRWLKVLMLIGLAGYILRGFAMMSEWLPLVITCGISMHGFSFAFFYIVAAMYIDREAPPHLRASAQAVVSFAASGVGPWVGNLFAATIVDQHRIGMIIDWPDVWQVPLIGSIILFAAFAVLFRPNPEKPPS